MNLWTEAAAEKAFDKAARARRRSLLVQRLARRCVPALPVHAEPLGAGTGAVRDIPLEAIAGTFEPNRAREFDHAFRPAKQTRRRWMRVWTAEQSGAILPPIQVGRIGDAYAVRDGHHRVSVARARGALTITAIIA